MKIRIAIDPGMSGAMAVSIDGTVSAYDCPSNQAEMVELVEEVRRLANINEASIQAVIERVHSMPGQGVVSVWKFSANYATWQTALICNDIPFSEVTPQSWMKKLGGLPKDKTARKNAIKDKMSKLYPKLKVTLKTADALGILTTEFLSS